MFDFDDCSYFNINLPGYFHLPEMGSDEESSNHLLLIVKKEKLNDYITLFDVRLRALIQYLIMS